MYRVEKKFDIAVSHKLDLPYESKCNNLHGHNLWITVSIRAQELTDYGMVIDFTHIKRAISKKLDHAHLNDLFDFNTTSENLAKWIRDEIQTLCNDENPSAVCYRVEVEESTTSKASYEVGQEWNA